MKKTIWPLLLVALTACAGPGPDISPRAGNVSAIRGNDIVGARQPAPQGQNITRTLGDPVVTPAGFAPPQNATQSPPPAAQADAFARSFLNSIQARSFAGRREFCGYFFVRPNGQIGATNPIPGTFAGCEQPIPQPGQGVFASYHTHGAYGRGYDNEVPSPTDLEGDLAFGIDGYVSTPGGRVWKIEFDTRDTFQICGRGCVAVDPGFVPEGERGIRQRYNLPQLIARGR